MSATPAAARKHGVTGHRSEGALGEKLSAHTKVTDPHGVSGKFCQMHMTRGPKNTAPLLGCPSKITMADDQHSPRFDVRRTAIRGENASVKRIQSRAKLASLL